MSARTEVAAEVLRRNAIRIAEVPGSQDHLIVLDRWPLAAKDRIEVSGAHRMAGRYVASLITHVHPYASPVPMTAPASTSLRKCIPSTMREAAILAAQKSRPTARSG